MQQTKWVLIDQTNGAKTSRGESLTAAVLANIAEACTAQLNKEVAAEHGGTYVVRVGANAKDIQPGERVYAFLPTLPDAPGASAYHDINKKGVPAAFCAVTTCDTLIGAGASVSVDASHEMIETAGDEGCNQLADDLKGTEHARELCDAVEVQTYPKTCANGTVVYVSNFLLRAWFIPHASGPFDYMTAASLQGAVAPPGPMQTAKGHRGNYQIECPSTTSQETQVTARHVKQPARIVGTSRKAPNGIPHWSSRPGRRLAALNAH